MKSITLRVLLAILFPRKINNLIDLLISSLVVVGDEVEGFYNSSSNFVVLRVLPASLSVADIYALIENLLQEYVVGIHVVAETMEHPVVGPVHRPQKLLLTCEIPRERRNVPEVIMNLPRLSLEDFKGYYPPFYEMPGHIGLLP